MTTIRLDREDIDMTSMIKFINIVLMCLTFFGSVLLLKWAVSEKLSHNDITATTAVTSQVRERQLGCLAKNIYYEAGSEPFEGKVAVAQVTMNRVNSGQFSNDVCGVIYQKNIFYEKVVCQFSWVCDRVSAFDPKNKANYDESMIAAQKVLLEDYRLPGLRDALYYHADYVHPGWKKEQVAKIGHHIFYK